MDTITMKKDELKNLIKETLDEYFTKYDFVSDKEQNEIEKLYGEGVFKKEIVNDDFVEL